MVTFISVFCIISFSIRSVYAVSDHKFKFVKLHASFSLENNCLRKQCFFSEKRIVEILISYSKYKYNLREFHEKLVIKVKIARTGNLQRNNAGGIHDEKFSRNFSFISEWLSFASAFVCSLGRDEIERKIDQYHEIEYRMSH